MEVNWSPVRGVPRNGFPRTIGIAMLVVALAAGCALPTMREVQGPPRPESVIGLTERGVLVRFNAGQPQAAKVIGEVRGLDAGETLLAIDFRVARRALFGLSSAGRLYTIDVASAQARAVGMPMALLPSGNEFGFDFNPAVDRIRIVSDTGQNFRANPDTGTAVDSNPNVEGVQPDWVLAFAPADINSAIVPRLVAAAYTYNRQDAKLTTNYALDAASGSLVTQGTKEGATPPAISPNTGQLFTVGGLGLGRRFSRAAFDIGGVTNAAYAAITLDGAKATRFYAIDLDTGSASFIGTVAGEALRGIAIEP